MKINILKALLESGLAQSEQEARGLVLSGKVMSHDKMIDKPGTLISDLSSLRLRNHKTDIARSAAKIRPAFSHWNIEIQNKITMDVGSSTGGFVQVLLENNARTVFAVDVGYGLLNPALRKSEQVIILERTRIEDLTIEQLPASVEFFTVDVSFTSLMKVLPNIHTLCSNNARGLALLKPQFEISRELAVNALQNGILTDQNLREEVILKIIEQLPSVGFSLLNRHAAFLAGMKGNLEEILYLQKN